MDELNRPTWNWSGEAAKVGEEKGGESEDIQSRTFERASSIPKGSPTTPEQSVKEEEEEDTEPTGNNHNEEPPRQERHYRPRKCRICLEEVHPTITQAHEGIAGMLNPRPRVEYISEDPSLGPLIRPCLCKGSMKWIHEGCLETWRNTNPGSRNYWQCGTCKFQYRLQRMDWARYIGGKASHIGLTLLIVFITIWVLGFFGDAIINFYLDPFDVLYSGGLTDPVLEEDENTWYFHLLKGLASLGLLGFMKSMIIQLPLRWPGGGPILGGGRRRGRGVMGRDRMANISWWIVAIGVVSFLFAVYQFVQAWSARFLAIARSRVADVHGNEDDDEDDE